MIGASQLRDSRQLAVVLALALGYYATARIPWRSVRPQWIYLLVVISFFAFFNTVITGGRTGTFSGADTHVLLTIPPFGAEISAEGMSLMLSQILRYAGVAAIGFPIAYAIAPGDLGVALRRLGVADKIAIMVDLTIRFIPTLSGEFAETIDAQRVRGYDPTDRKGGPIRRLRRLAPIFVPVTVGSIAGAEDTIDAMDLRGFGVGRRSWLRHLQFDRLDALVIGLFVLFAIAATFLNVTGRTDHFLLPLPRARRVNPIPMWTGRG